MREAVIAAVLFIAAALIATVTKQFLIKQLSTLSYGKLLANITAGIILLFGIMLALAEIGVAVILLLPLIYLIPFTIAGIAVVGFGGALVTEARPLMRKMLNMLDNETETIKSQHTPPVEITNTEPGATLKVNRIDSEGNLL